MRAMRYFERRLLHSALLLVTVSMLSFAASQLAPGSFLDDMKLNPQISADTVDSLRAQYGLDQPLLVRYFRWLKSAATADLGYSVAYKLPVSKLLPSRIRNTLLLGTTATFSAWLFALPVGIWSGYRPGRWVDRLGSGTSMLLLATPELALALLVILFVAHFGTLPAGGMTSAQEPGSPWQAAADLLRHLALPALILAVASFPILLRHIRAAMLETWDSTFVHAAKGHGIGDARLLLRHVLPAACNPLISLFGLSLATLVSGSFLVEVVMGWPGLGPLFLEGVYGRDFHVVVAVVMLFSVFLIVANLIADLLLYTADPRVRAEC